MIETIVSIAGAIALYSYFVALILKSAPTLSLLFIILSVMGVIGCLIGMLSAIYSLYGFLYFVGIFICLSTATTSSFYYKSKTIKTATQSEQIKVPVKTKSVTENKLKQKHSQ